MSETSETTRLHGCGINGCQQVEIYVLHDKLRKKLYSFKDPSLRTKTQRGKRKTYITKKPKSLSTDIAQKTIQS